MRFVESLDKKAVAFHRVHSKFTVLRPTCRYIPTTAPEGEKTFVKPIVNHEKPC